MISAGVEGRGFVHDMLLVLQEESNIVTTGLFDERCPKHSLPSECLSSSPTLSRDFSNHKDLSKISVEKMNSLINIQAFWGREMM